jgi:leucyl/phenylalanyl-tRNA--protein transferase
MRVSLPWLDPVSLEFPDPSTALTTPNGLLAAGGDLSPARLLCAYHLGIFPWFSDGQPILWWSPDPRMVLLPAELHISRSLAKTLRSGRFTFSSDQAFADVLLGCAGNRRDSDGTWLDIDMQQAYSELHRLGHAHSVETWRNGKLVGGVYGVALEGIFFGESMFSRESDASKAALATLVKALIPAGYRLIDCQVTNPHLATLGARQIARQEFMQYLPSTADISRPAHWPLQ